MLNIGGEIYRGIKKAKAIMMKGQGKRDLIIFLFLALRG
jgi:hypothetical protein